MRITQVLEGGPLMPSQRQRILLLALRKGREPGSEKKENFYLHGGNTQIKGSLRRGGNYYATLDLHGKPLRVGFYGLPDMMIHDAFYAGLMDNGLVGETYSWKSMTVKSIDDPTRIEKRGREALRDMGMALQFYPELFFKFRSKRIKPHARRSKI